MAGLADEPMIPNAADLAEDPEQAAYRLLAEDQTANASAATALAVLALVTQIKGLRKDLRSQRTPPTMPEKRP